MIKRNLFTIATGRMHATLVAVERVGIILRPAIAVLQPSNTMSNEVLCYPSLENLPSDRISDIEKYIGKKVYVTYKTDLFNSPSEIVNGFVGAM